MNRRVIAAVSDMLFASKIRGTAEQLNVTVSFARTEEGLFDNAKTETPALIIPFKRNVYQRVVNEFAKFAGE